MAYISQFVARSDVNLNDLGECHRFVCSLFPNEGETSGPRISPLHYKNGNQFITLTRTSPLDLPSLNVRTKLFDPKIENGWQLQFHLKANPTTSINRRRIPVLGEKNRLDWLKKVLATSGCELAKAHICAYCVERGLHRSWEKPMTFNSVTFRGLLRVKDKDNLLDSVKRGFGRGKAYGFGLLLFVR